MRPYEVNLCGLSLTVNGLGFQQQDGGVAVCASSALWMALQRVSFMNGNRSPTPSAVTRAAASPFPTGDGLRVDQMATALSTLGYIADYFVPGNNRRLFKAKIGACLRSALPVVLLIDKKRYDTGDAVVGHAVTVTGYSDPLPPLEVDLETASVDPILVGSASLAEIYVHDDNLGFHLHYKLIESDEENDDGYKKLLLQRGLPEKPIEGWTIDTWAVTAALVPKPEWHRLPVRKLVDEIGPLRHYVELAFSELPINYETRFVSGVDFKRSLFRKEFDPAEVLHYVQSVSLPRCVGLIECFSGEDELCSFAIDVSEAKRTKLPTVLLCAAPGVKDDFERKQMHHMCDPDKWPLLLAKP